MKNMEKEQKPDQQELKSEEEIKIVDGKRYKKVSSGYTVRQYYSHETPEKGPGPGWDRFVNDAEEIAKEYGIELKKLGDLMRFNPNDLPDEPYYQWKQISESEDKM